MPTTAAAGTATAGGNICYADTPTAMNREHAILQPDRCVAVSPSDTAPALIALDAQMVIRRRGSERVVDAADYFMGPGTDIPRMTVLQPGELLTAIRIPAAWASARFYFEKARDRQVWDVPLVNVASSIKMNGNRIAEARIAVGAVAARPLRLTSVEQAIAGRPLNEDTATMAGELAIEGAAALRQNAYKSPLMRNLVRRAVRGGPLQATTSDTDQKGVDWMNVARATAVVFLVLGAVPFSIGCEAPPARAEQAPPTTCGCPLGGWSGNGSRHTESFDVTTGALRLRWESRAKGASPSGQFRVWLYSAISGRPLQLVVEKDGAGSGTAHMADDPRVSYLVIGSEHVDWTATLEEAVVTAARH